MKVSVLLTTYNHEKYIAQAIDSVLMQQTNFHFEIVIMEDRSTDNTRDIVKNYQRSYPEIIRLILSEENKNDNSNFVTAWLTSASPYVALLDGDDYWTSPHKLQRQVDFLDGRNDCALCFHDVAIVHEADRRDENQDTNYDNLASWSYAPGYKKEISTLEDLLAYNFIAGCSPMLRRTLIDKFPNWYLSAPSGDWPLYILCAQHGKIGRIDEVMGVYRLHSRGLWAGLSSIRKLEEVIGFLESTNRRLNFEYAEVIKAAVSKHRKELAVEKAKAAESKAQLGWRSKGIDYQQLVRAVGEVVRTTLSPDAAVAVVSRGDEELLKLDGRRVWQFPPIENSGPERLFAQGSEGSQEAPWIGAGTAYEFRLYSGTGRETLLATATVTRSGEASVAAAPNPVPEGAGLGTTTVSWSTGDAPWGQVYLCTGGQPEKLFAQGSEGSQEAPWIGAGTAYEFRLYSGTGRETLLATATVTRSGEASVAAAPNPVPEGAGLGTTTVSWSTGDAPWGQVYVSSYHLDHHYPADGAEAVAHLEALRGKGAEYLLLPSTAFWWLEHYPELNRHLEGRYRAVVRQEDACLIFALGEPPGRTHVKSGNEHAAYRRKL